MKDPIHINPNNKGLLHRKLGVAGGKPIPDAALRKGAHSDSEKLRKEAQFALNAKKWRKK